MRPITTDRRKFLRNALVAGATVGLGDWAAPFGESRQDDRSLPSKLAGSEQEHVTQMLIDGVRSVELARSILSAEAGSARLKEASSYVVGKYGTWEDAPVLLRAIAHPSHQVRRTAILAFQKILRPYNQNVPLRVRDTEVLLPPQFLPQTVGRWVSAICPLLKDESHLMRASAAETLGLLKSLSCLPQLRDLVDTDPMEPVRYFASQSIQLLAGEAVDFIDVNAAAQAHVPLATVTKANSRDMAQQLGPFLRAAWFNQQAKFTIPEGIPARHQTIATLWWNQVNLCLEVICEDLGALDNRGDQFTFFLQPEGESRVHSFECKAGGGQAVWLLLNNGHRSVVEAVSDVIFSTERDSGSWKASLQIPFRALGREGAPKNEVWRANIVRVESHGGGRPEVSSWTYFHRDAPGIPRLGSLQFAARSPRIELHPKPDNLFVFPVDDYSPAKDRNRVIEAANETHWGRVAPPEHLVHGVNTFSFSVDFSDASQHPLRLLVTAYEGTEVVASDSQELEPQRLNMTQSLRIPHSLKARALDVEIRVEERDSGRKLLRNWFPSVPVVSPPKQVLHYPLHIIEDRNYEWPAKTIDRGSWKIHDHGPMLLTESYPMCLVQGTDGLLYGGTYPGGRLFSYDPEAGVVQDLGSPSPPHNHLHDLVAAPDGLIFGGLYRPEGRLFVFDPKSKTTTDLGVPVPGGFSATCKVTAWAKGRVYGCQRGHLFFAEPSMDKVVNKGNFLLNGRCYQPSTILSDSNGKLLGVAGGHLFRYLPAADQVLISDIEFKPQEQKTPQGGWLLQGPEGRVYALFHDGRLLRWEPDADRLVLVTRYTEVKPGPGVSLVLTETKELIVGRSGILKENENVLLVYGPRRTQPVSLGNPIPGHLYLTALTLGRDNVVYGVSARRAYSLERTPIHIYSLRP
ncbi:MAG: HEAT repeat domain-containing protein [Acidobacteria bacterium]|nr:HEAT repeat domain-containing protein [Acidobacteriota bacterium]